MFHLTREAEASAPLFPWTGAPCLHRRSRGTTWVEQDGAEPLPLFSFVCSEAKETKSSLARRAERCAANLSRLPRLAVGRAVEGSAVLRTFRGNVFPTERSIAEKYAVFPCPGADHGKDLLRPPAPQLSILRNRQTLSTTRINVNTPRIRKSSHNPKDHITAFFKISDTFPTNFKDGFKLDQM
jgi:hypothetical protein